MPGLGGLYERLVLPRLICASCASPAIMKQRAKVVPLAEGRVLELGIGGGLNLGFYDLSRVSQVTGIDPSAALRARALSAPRPEGLAVEVIAGEAEALPFETASFDTIVCTFTLCSVRLTDVVLGEARRVLRPDGRLLFSEHGLSPDLAVARWQRRIEPLWKRLAGGCHLSRPVTGAIAAAGFRVDWSQSMYLPGAPRFAGWAEWGVAMPA